jgi:hypothetical protein
MQAHKVASHLRKQKVAAPVDFNTETPLDATGQRFVWTKKIEKDIMHGVSVSEFSSRAEKRRQEERQVGPRSPGGCAVAGLPRIRCRNVLLCQCKASRLLSLFCRWR